MGGLFQLSGGRWGFPGLGCSLLLDLYGWPWNCILVLVGVSFSLLMCYTEVQGLVEIGLSAILDLFGSNQFMSCPQAVSFF